MVDGRGWVAWSCCCRSMVVVVTMTPTATTAAVARAPMAMKSKALASCRSTDFSSNETNEGGGDSVQVHPCHLTFSLRLRCSVGRLRADNM